VKLPRDLSGEEVCRALKRLGFEFVRPTGAHRAFGERLVASLCADAPGNQTQNVTIHFETG
jgi:hypothetical protein